MPFFSPQTLSQKPVELHKPALPFWKGFFLIINDFLKCQKALKPFFIATNAHLSSIISWKEKMCMENDFNNFFEVVGGQLKSRV